MIRVTCPYCQKQSAVQENSAGGPVMCPHCSQSFPVAMAVQPPTAPTIQVQQPPQQPQQPGSGSPYPSPPPGSLITPNPSSPPPLQASIAPENSTAYVPTHRCPGCGRDVPQNSMLCTDCGWNFQTGKHRKGFISSHEKKMSEGEVKNVIVTVVLIILLVGDIWVIYDAVQGGPLKKRMDEIGNRIDEEIDDSRPSYKDKRKRSSKRSGIASRPKASSLRVKNNGSRDISVFKDGTVIGKVSPGAKKSFPISLPKMKSKKIKIGCGIGSSSEKTFEFSGSDKTGMELIIAGPPSGVLPTTKTKFKNIDWGEIKILEDGSRGLPSIYWKGYTLKPVGGNEYLKFQPAERSMLRWVEQPCRVESAGKLIFDPSVLSIQPKEFDL